VRHPEKNAQRGSTCPPQIPRSGEDVNFSIDTAENLRGNVETLLKEAGLIRRITLDGETTITKTPLRGLIEAVTM